MSSPAFINLRKQARTNPESIPALLEMLQQNYPTLFALFNQNPHLLIAILAGNFAIQNDQNMGLGVGAEIDGPVEQPQGNLTQQDMIVIQSVILLAYGNGIHSATMH